LEAWGLGSPGDHDLTSLNDVAVAGGALYVLSRSSGRLAQLGLPVQPDADSVAVLDSWQLPSEIQHPEGLTFLYPTTPIVADDRSEYDDVRHNIFRLQPLPATDA